MSAWQLWAYYGLYPAAGDSCACQSCMRFFPFRSLIPSFPFPFPRQRLSLHSRQPWLAVRQHHSAVSVNKPSGTCDGCAWLVSRCGVRCEDGHQRHACNVIICAAFRRVQARDSECARVLHVDHTRVTSRVGRILLVCVVRGFPRRFRDRPHSFVDFSQ